MSRSGPSAPDPAPATADGPAPSSPPRVAALADGAVLVDSLTPATIATLTAALGPPPPAAGPASRPDRPAGPGLPTPNPAGGVLDLVATADSLLVVVDPDRVAVEEVAATIAALLQHTAPTRDDAATGDEPARSDAEPVEIPVSFDGPDLAAVAERTGLGVAGVVGALTGAELTVAFLGFAPGFAYLRGLPGALAAVPRRASPRPRVEAGTVALAGGFAAVYPQASPGGWQLVGTTDLLLFDPDRPPFALLQPGQTVRFVARDPARATRPARRPPARRRPLRATGPAYLRVDEPGPATTVQDAGRRGLAHLGVPAAGPADPIAHELANRLVGNPPGTAALEVTGTGPVLYASADTFVALVGNSRLAVDGWPVPVAAPVPVSAGQRIEIGPVRGGVRAVLAVAGGLAVPRAVGSMSSDALCGLGVGPLAAGDELTVAGTGRPAGRLLPELFAASALADWATLVGLAPEPPPTGPPPAGLPPDRLPPAVELAVVVGPDATEATRRALVTSDWLVLPASNRVGLRLGRPPTVSAAASTRRDSRTPSGPTAPPPIARVTSRGVVTGTVQLPPDGQPIVLLCDHATTGGYPMVATLCSVDLATAGQLRPGARVRLVEVTAADAGARRRAVRRLLDRAVTGVYPVRAG